MMKNEMNREGDRCIVKSIFGAKFAGLTRLSLNPKANWIKCDKTGIGKKILQGLTTREIF